MAHTDPGSISDIHLDHVLNGVNKLFLWRQNFRLVEMNTNRTLAAMEVNQKLNLTSC